MESVTIFLRHHMFIFKVYVFDFDYEILGPYILW